MNSNNKPAGVRLYNSFVHAIKNIIEGIKYGINGSTQPKAMQPVKLYVRHVMKRGRNQ